MLSLYLAAPFPLRDQARAIAAQLTAAGFTVTSTWLHVDDMPDSDDAARLDLDDIDRAHALVLLNPPAYANAGTGGRHAEFGYALGAGKALIVFGARSNVFHHLSAVDVIASEDLEAVDALIAHLVGVAGEFLVDAGVRE